MKIRTGLCAAIILTSLAAGSARAVEEQSKVIVLAGDADAGQAGDSTVQKHVIVRSIAGGGGKLASADTVWLGVGVEEGSDVLAAQLGLRPGEGLVVNFVSTNSPAAAAGLKENDVLVELDGQTLVDPTQLRKLIRMHEAGDTIKVAYFHAGKKQTASAKLTKKENVGFSFDGENGAGGLENFNFQVHDLPGGDKGDLSLQIKKAMESAQIAIREAMKHTADGQDQAHKMQIITKKLGKLADGGVNLDQDATVVVKSDTESVRTIVKTDDTGSYVILADPRKHLTVHDKQGKLLFDGSIETAEQQKKVPAEIWKQTAPMLEQLNAQNGGKEKQ